MDDPNAISTFRNSQSQDRVPLTCPGCGIERQMRIWEYRKRKSDYCQPCGNRIRVGLLPTGAAGKGTRLYNIWRDMRQRCGLFRGAKEQDVKTYQERGITVCRDWATSFGAFQSWAEASGYHADLVLDREDNDRGYEPSNCRWVTVLDSNRNRRCVKLSTEQVADIRRRIATGGRGIQTLLAREYGVSDGQISVIKSGKSWTTG